MKRRRIVKHQFVERQTGSAVNEKLYKDAVIRFLYSSVRENGHFLFKALTGHHSSSLIGYMKFDIPFVSPLGRRAYARNVGINFYECVEPVRYFNTPRKIFERKIRYWDLRPMEDDSASVASPADSKILFGSFEENSMLYIKDKFFSYDELLGRGKHEWNRTFSNGSFAIFRLTPEKYHYNHSPVSGVVSDIYEISGKYHSCNPGAVVELVDPYSKNKRVVTVIDTDVPGGTNIGKVAMIEVVALMIGEIRQAYSEAMYDSPVDVKPGIFLCKGQPKSLFRPGSSTVILLFEKGSVSFEKDIMENQMRKDINSRFSSGFGMPLAETDVAVRSTIAVKKWKV